MSDIKDDRGNVVGKLETRQLSETGQMTLVGTLNTTITRAVSRGDRVFFSIDLKNDDIRIVNASEPMVRHIVDNLESSRALCDGKPYNPPTNIPAREVILCPKCFRKTFHMEEKR